jgi:hypothetical protein
VPNRRIIVLGTEMNPSGVPSMAPEGPASQVSSPSRLQIVRYGVPTLIGIAYFLFRFDLGYRPFLVDEHLFLDAMREGGLTFFPGYIGFLWCARAISHIFPPAASLEFIASLISALSVVVFWLWMRRWGRSMLVSVLGTLVFATGVFQLYYSSVGVTYPIETFGFLFTGYLADRAKEDRHSLVVAAIVLAFCGAIRPSTPVFLLPLFLYCCRRERTFQPVLLFMGLSLIWFVPTVAQYGGLAQFFAAGRSQLTAAVLPSTVAHNVASSAVNVLRFVVFLTYGAHVLLLAAIRQLRFFELIWILPAASFLAFFYIAWPGYMLGVLAVIVLLGVKSIASLRTPIAAIILASIAVLNCAQFYAVQPDEQPGSVGKAVITAYAFQYSRAALDHKFARRLKDLVK